MCVTSRRSYTAFGLTVRAEFELPELPRAERPARDDVVVERGTVRRPPGVSPETSVHQEGPEEYYLLYPAANVRVTGGRRIVVDPDPEAPHEVLRHLLLGPAFNHLLHQRDLFVLHASTVTIDGTAVAFCGESGAGKTTTAAAFLAAGHSVLSDDVAAVTFDPEPVVRSGYPSIKLDPEVVDQFDLSVTEPSRTCSTRSRHFYGLDQEQTTEPVPLERVYLLEDGDAVEFGSIPPRERLVELVANTYAGGVLEGDAEAAVNFEQSARLADSVEVRRLYRPRRLDAIDDVVAAVAADVRDR